MADTVYPASVERDLADLLQARTGITWSVVGTSRIPTAGTGLVEQLPDEPGGDWDKTVTVATTAAAATRTGARTLGDRIDRVMRNLDAIGPVYLDEVHMDFSAKIELIEGTTRFLVDSQWTLTVRADDAPDEA